MMPLISLSFFEHVADVSRPTPAVSSQQKACSLGVETGGLKLSEECALYGQDSTKALATALIGLRNFRPKV
jgi:hypothetical protein